MSVRMAQSVVKYMNCRVSQLLKEFGSQPDDCLWLDTEFKLSQKLAKLDSVDKIDRRSSVPSGLVRRGTGKSSCRDEQALICSSDHSSSEVSNFAWPNRAGVALALKADMK